jgi:hypothetical protein
VAELLDASPAVTIADVRGALGVAAATAQRVLSQLRGERIAALMEADPGLSFDQAAEQLGCPAAVRRAARDVATSAAELGA